MQYYCPYLQSVISDLEVDWLVWLLYSVMDLYLEC